MFERDEVLAAALRASLERPDRDRFVARVLAAVDATPVHPWGWLERWARLGIAASIAMLLGGVLLSRAAAAPATGDDAALLGSMGSTGAATTAFLLAERPDPGVVFADVVGEER